MENAVEITREQEKALLELRKASSDEHLIKEHLSYGNNWAGANSRSFKEMSSIDFIDMLRVGYVVKSTPEEDLHKHYLKLHADYCSSEDYTSRLMIDGMMIGIRRTLTLLNIEIEGVNK